MSSAIKAKVRYSSHKFSVIGDNCPLKTLKLVLEMRIIERVTCCWGPNLFLQIFRVYDEWDEAVGEVLKCYYIQGPRHRGHFFLPREREQRVLC